MGVVGGETQVPSAAVEVKHHRRHEIRFIGPHFALRSDDLKREPIVIQEFEVPVDASNPVEVFSNIVPGITHFFVGQDKSDIGFGKEVGFQAKNIHQTSLSGFFVIVFIFLFSRDSDVWGIEIIGG